jgi:hypothetical protein
VIKPIAAPPIRISDRSADVDVSFDQINNAAAPARAKKPGISEPSVNHRV